MMAVFEPFFAMLRVVPVLMGVLVLAAVVILPIMLVGALMKRSERRERGATGEEAELMQALYQGLTRLESRVESLETILLSKDSRGDKQ